MNLALLRQLVEASTYRSVATFLLFSWRVMVVKVKTRAPIVSISGTITLLKFDIAISVAVYVVIGEVNVRNIPVVMLVVKHAAGCHYSKSSFARCRRINTAAGKVAVL